MLQSVERCSSTRSASFSRRMVSKTTPIVPGLEARSERTAKTLDWASNPKGTTRPP